MTNAYALRGSLGTTYQLTDNYRPGLLLPDETTLPLQR